MWRNSNDGSNVKLMILYLDDLKKCVCVKVSSSGVFRNLVGDAEMSAESADVGDGIIFEIVDVGNKITATMNVMSVFCFL